MISIDVQDGVRTLVETLAGISVGTAAAVVVAGAEVSAGIVIGAGASAVIVAGAGASAVVVILNFLTSDQCCAQHINYKHKNRA